MKNVVTDADNIANYEKGEKGESCEKSSFVTDCGAQNLGTEVKRKL